MSTPASDQVKLAFQAHGAAGSIVRDTPKEAAMAYFQSFPKSRKCSVIQGEVNGHFFTVRYGRASKGEWPQSYKDVTKAKAPTLGEEQ